jgi:hypothetical protein
MAMAMSAPTHIRTQADLIDIPRLGRGSRVLIEIPELALGNAHRLEIQLNRLLHECGCRWSAAFLVTGMVLAGGVDILAFRRIGGHVPTVLFCELLAVASAAVVGRLFGRLVARLRLGKAVRLAAFTHFPR